MGYRREKKTAGKTKGNEMGRRGDDMRPTGTDNAAERERKRRKDFGRERKRTTL